jgi:hypothetical protein
MVNEHYVPQSYLRLFAPDGEGVISRYGLTDKHPGDEYRRPKDRYSIRKAASRKDFADGLLEGNDTVRTEQAVIEAIRTLLRGESLSRDDVACISQFLAFQHGRGPSFKLQFEARNLLSEITEHEEDDLNVNPDIEWEAALAHNANSGHETLQHMGWLLVTNDSNIPFITSDQPVVHYFSRDFDDVESTPQTLEGREIHCPLSPEQLLVLLDPSYFHVDSQHPETEIQQVTVEDAHEIQKWNQLQCINAFQEVFGPVGHGQMLERIVERLCEAFPDEEFVRGTAADFEAIQRAQYVGSGQFLRDDNTDVTAEMEWYAETGKQILQARRKEANALWTFDHQLELVEGRQRNSPRVGYWSNL